MNETFQRKETSERYRKTGFRWVSYFLKGQERPNALIEIISRVGKNDVQFMEETCHSAKISPNLGCSF